MAPEDTHSSFYRTSADAEIDLLLNLPNGQTWAVEIKRSLTPKVERGFHSACEDLRPDRKFLVYPGAERFPVARDIEAVGLEGLARELALIR